MNLLQINDKTVEGKKGILKVPLVRVGKWAHKAAKVIQFSISDLNQIIKNFKDNILQHKPYLTYGHVIEPYSYDSHRKKGDLIDMSIEGDVLYGYFKANPSTYQSVLDGDYEFASVEYVKDHIDPKTGENVGMVLLRTALTNSPFLPGDIKIEALSQNPSTDRLFTTIPIASKNNINIMADSSTQNLSNTATLEREQTEVVNNEKQNIPETDTQSVKNNTQEPNNSVSPNQDDSKVEIKVEAKDVAPKEYTGDIASLKEEITELKKQWLQAQELTQELTKYILEQKKNGKDDEPKEKGEVVKQTVDSSEEKVDKESKEKEEDEVKNEDSINKEQVAQEEIKASQEVNKSSTTIDKDDSTGMNLTNTELNNLNSYVKNNAGPLDIKGLVQSIRDRVSSAYSAQLQDSQTMVQTLQQQLNEIKNQAEEERRQREAYALSLQEAQNQAFLASTDLTRDHLIGNGVPPELANQFIQVQSGLLTQQNKVNLSLDGQEPKELDITEALCELFIRAVSCNPVNLSVSGQSTFSGGTYDPTGRTQRIKQVIERNRKRAQELYK